MQQVSDFVNDRNMGLELERQKGDLGKKRVWRERETAYLCRKREIQA